jgi:hypothetical protein
MQTIKRHILLRVVVMALVLMVMITSTIKGEILNSGEGWVCGK